MVVVAGAAVLRGSGGAGGGPAAARAPAAGLAPAPDAAFRIGPPVELGDPRHETRWAPVRRAAVVRARPDAAAPAVARLARRTPEETANVVVALDRREDAGGHLWVRARLPGEGTGWVPRAALGGYGVVTTRLVVDLDALTAELTDGGRRVFRASIGVGTADAPTPSGEFYVRNKLTRYRSPFYGPIAFGTSARSPTLTDWPDGGFVGIHGTNRPDLLPGRVSHGCIRLRNADILALARLMPVGTPIKIT